MIAGAVAGYMVFPHWSGVFVGMVGGMVPDIDEPNSKISRIGLLRLMAYPVSFVFKHRSMTHSLAFLFSSFLLSLIFFVSGLSALSFWIEANMRDMLAASLFLAIAYSMGMASHLLCDMLTGKIKLLYPSPKSYGISIPRWSYHLVDMVFRIMLIGVVVWGVLSGNVLSKLLTFKSFIY